jgi:hypothetical protein
MPPRKRKVMVSRPYFGVFLTRLVAEFSRAGLPAVRSTLASGVRGLMRLLESPSLLPPSTALSWPHRRSKSRASSTRLHPLFLKLLPPSISRVSSLPMWPTEGSDMSRRPSGADMEDEGEWS